MKFLDSSMLNGFCYLYENGIREKRMSLHCEIIRRQILFFISQIFGERVKFILQFCLNYFNIKSQLSKILRILFLHSTKLKYFSHDIADANITMKKIFLHNVITKNHSSNFHF